MFQMRRMGEMRLCYDLGWLVWLILVEDGARGWIWKFGTRREGWQMSESGFGHGERFALSWLGPGLEDVSPFPFSAVTAQDRRFDLVCQTLFAEA